MPVYDAFTFAGAAVESNALLERLGIASIEAAVLGAAVWLLIRFRFVRAPRLIALCWLLVMVKPVVSLVTGPVIGLDAGTILSNDLSAAEPHTQAYGVTRPVAEHALSDTGYAGLTTINTRNALPAFDDPAMIGTAVITLWCGGVFLLLMLVVRDRIRSRRLAQTLAPPDMQHRVRDAAHAAGLRTAPAVWLTDTLDSPAVLGYFRPKIVIPRWIFAEKGSGIGWILRHELTHLRHLDHLANGVRRMAQTLFFFHPVVWIAGRQWEEAAEIACDEAVAGTPREAREYARRLYGLLVNMQHQPGAAVPNALYASRTQVGRRIEALLRREKPPARASRVRRVAFTLFAALVLIAGIGSRAGSTTGIIGGDEDHAHRFRTEIEESSLTYTYRVRAEGTIGFSKNHETITSMSQDAWLTGEVETLRHELSFAVQRSDDGSIEIEYAVDGTDAELDEEGRTWLRRLIQSIGRERD